MCVVWLLSRLFGRLIKIASLYDNGPTIFSVYQKMWWGEGEHRGPFSISHTFSTQCEIKSCIPTRIVDWWLLHLPTMIAYHITLSLACTWHKDNKSLIFHRHSAHIHEQKACFLSFFRSHGVLWRKKNTFFVTSRWSAWCFFLLIYCN